MTLGCYMNANQIGKKVYIVLWHLKIVYISPYGIEWCVLCAFIKLLGNVVNSHGYIVRSILKENYEHQCPVKN